MSAISIVICFHFHVNYVKFLSYVLYCLLIPLKTGREQKEIE